MTAWYKIGFYHWIQFQKPVKYESIVWRFVETFERLQSGFGGIRYCYQKQLPNGALKFSQNSQENNYARVSFVIKLQAEACNFIKKETLAQVFSCKFCEIFKSTFFTEHLWTIAFSQKLLMMFFYNIVETLLFFLKFVYIYMCVLGRVDFLKQDRIENDWKQA